MDLIEKSELIIYLLNNNEPLTDKEIEILNKVKEKNYIIVVNKCDLESKIDLTKLPKDVIKMSVVNDEGIKELKSHIKQIFNLDKIETNDLTYLTSSRNIAIVKQCLEKIVEVREGINNEVPIDIIEIDIKEIWNLLGKIIGETYEDELINQLFSQFCLGK